jgi:hypothetical protein
MEEGVLLVTTVVDPQVCAGEVEQHVSLVKGSTWPWQGRRVDKKSSARATDNERSCAVMATTHAVAAGNRVARSQDAENQDSATVHCYLQALLLVYFMGSSLCSFARASELHFSA